MANAADSGPAKRSGRAKAAIAVLSFYVLVTTGGLGVARFQSVPVPAVVRDAVQSHTSTLGLAAALGVAGLFGLVIFTRRRSPRRMAPAVIQSRPMIFEKPQENLHPLFTTQRTVRDNSFVFKKTRKKGRLYRNRAGEKVLHKPDD